MATFEEYLQEHEELIYTVVGDSMMPLLRQKRDLVIVKKPEGRLKRYDVPLYRRDSGQYVLHRILQVREQDYVICGANRWQREYGITDRHIIGVMTGIIRDGKTISVTDPDYLAYVHKQCDFFWLRAVRLWCRALPKRIRRKFQRR